MPCCMSGKFGEWCKNEDTLKISGIDYCIFHLPKDSNSKRYNKIFNARIEQKISESIELNGVCVLNGADFPDGFSFLGLCNSFSHLSLCGCRFSNANISNVKFDNSVDFNGAIFQGIADFSDVNFYDNVSFMDAKFVGYADFSRAKFNKDSRFYKTVFENEANFWLATFMGNTSFEFAKFKNTSDFSETEFQSDANFFAANFIGWASFCKTIFSDNFATDFRDIVAGLTGSNQIVLFSGVSLKSLIFTSIELEKMLFKYCIWPDRLFLERALGHTNYELMGEVEYPEVEELYRNLKQRAVTEQDMTKASDWHYREKLMCLEQIRRHNAGCSRWRNLLTVTWWYWFSSGFGERPDRAVWVLLGLFGVLLACLAGSLLFETGLTSTPDWTKIKDMLLAWPQYALFVSQPAYTPVCHLGRFAVLVCSKLLIPLQAALFVLALRNRFRR